MKRIIDGKAYNTETATHVAQAEEREDRGDRGDSNAWDTCYNLYRTKGGAFFLVISEWVVTDPDNPQEIRAEFHPLSYDDAHLFASGKPIRIGWRALDAQQVERLVGDVFPTVEEASDPEAPTKAGARS